MDDQKVTRLLRRGPDVSSELAVIRRKIRFILEATYGSSVQKPLSLEATIGLGVIIYEIDQGLAEIEEKLGYSKD
jgi:hypothetical protein